MTRGKIKRFVQIAKYTISIVIVIYQSAQKIYRIKNKMSSQKSSGSKKSNVSTTK